MRHNRNEIEEKYEEVRKQVIQKVFEFQNRKKLFLKSTCVAFFDSINNQWKTKTTIHK